MGKISLDTSEQIKPPVIANEVHDAHVTLQRDKIHVRLDWYYQPYEQIGTAAPIATGTPVLVKNEGFDITGSDYDDIANATVKQAHVGEKFFTLFRRGLRSKIKQMRNLQGTDHD